MRERPPEFCKIVEDYKRLLKQPLVAPGISASPVSTARPVRDETRPCALMLSPHPDDECLTGGLPLRLLKEQNWQVINIAVTLGSNQARRDERKTELAKASAMLGYNSVLPEDSGFSSIEDSRVSDPLEWRKKVMRIAEMIAHFQPQAIFLPHAFDWHTTHIGTHWLAMEALAAMPQNLSCFIIQTEYWQPMVDPNLMIGLDADCVTMLMSGLACHTGEVARNPYDRRFPSYLIDNVRRGGERLKGPGTVSNEVDFCMMYKFGVWRQGKFVPSALNRLIGTGDSVAALFE